MWVECPLCNFHLLFLVMITALIVVVNRLSGLDCYVVIPLGIIICLPAGGASVGEVYFTECHFMRVYPIFVFVILAFVAVGNRLSIKNGYVAIPVGTITCVQAVGAGVGLSCLSTTSLSSLLSSSSYS